ncbi:hypothetical protein ACFSLT_01460 [Novosphingobium resinovorum]
MRTSTTGAAATVGCGEGGGFRVVRRLFGDRLLEREGVFFGAFFVNRLRFGGELAAAAAELLRCDLRLIRQSFRRFAAHRQRGQHGKADPGHQQREDGRIAPLHADHALGERIERGILPAQRRERQPGSKERGQRKGRQRGDQFLHAPGFFMTTASSGTPLDFDLDC